MPKQEENQRKDKKLLHGSSKTELIAIYNTGAEITSPTCAKSHGSFRVGMELMIFRCATHKHGMALRRGCRQFSSTLLITPMELHTTMLPQSALHRGPPVKTASEQLQSAIIVSSDVQDEPCS